MENAVLLLFDEPEECSALLGLMEEQEQVVLDAVADVAPAVVHFPDNLDSGNFAGFYDRYMREPYRRRLQKLHGAGVTCAVHLD